MREDQVVQIDGGPRVKAMTRLAVEYIAERENLPMSQVWQTAMEAFLVDFNWTEAELADYYGRRAHDLDRAMHEMKLRGLRQRKTARRGLASV